LNAISIRNDENDSDYWIASSNTNQDIDLDKSIDSLATKAINYFYQHAKDYKNHSNEQNFNFYSSNKEKSQLSTNLTHPLQKIDKSHSSFDDFKFKYRIDKLNLKKQKLERCMRKLFNRFISSRFKFSRSKISSSSLFLILMLSARFNRSYSNSWLSSSLMSNYGADRNCLLNLSDSIDKMLIDCSYQVTSSFSKKSLFNKDRFIANLCLFIFVTTIFYLYMFQQTD
jgi:hypothetical protein